jgi:hypothetical protein
MGININEKTKPIELFKNLLDKIGYKIQRVKRAKKEGKRFWVYSKPAHNFAQGEDGLLKDTDGKPIPIDDGRNEIFELWEMDYLQRILAIEREKEESMQALAMAHEQAKANEPEYHQLNLANF